MRLFKVNEGNNLTLKKVEVIFSYFYSDFPIGVSFSKFDHDKPKYFCGKFNY